MNEMDTTKCPGCGIAAIADTAPYCSRACLDGAAERILKIRAEWDAHDRFKRQRRDELVATARAYLAANSDAEEVQVEGYLLGADDVVDPSGVVVTTLVVFKTGAFFCSGFEEVLPLEPSNPAHIEATDAFYIWSREDRAFSAGPRLNDLCALSEKLAAFTDVAPVDGALVITRDDVTVRWNSCLELE